MAALALTVACKKDDKTVEPPVQPELVEVTYQLEAFTDAPFESINYAAGKGGMTDEKGQEVKGWELDAGKGTYIRKTLIKRGKAIVFGASNPTSADFTLSISTKYETARIQAKDYPGAGQPGHYAEIILDNGSDVQEEKPVVTEMVAVTYEVRSFTDAPFRYVQYNEMQENKPGTRGTAFRNWVISGKGTFTKTVYIERGFGAFLSAKNLTSGDFVLSIKTKYESVSDIGRDYHIPGWPGYKADISLHNRED
ncbi:hypothetical protein SAMN04488128_105322 [Chitinophaga eiseniae]|uniref:Uncharacterized protein n=2 Tax=Chitinophaga eiseniae TaxID=634771 RepID=A0A1T4TKN8_9BACT|nr:hypothetical protein SAMN04488128_105322 [Chitinophaga eiseniae]